MPPLHPAVQAARAVTVPDYLPPAIREAMQMVANGQTDDGRARLANLREEHGAAVFQVAQFRAVAGEVNAR